MGPIQKSKHFIESKYNFTILKSIWVPSHGTISEKIQFLKPFILVPQICKIKKKFKKKLSRLKTINKNEKNEIKTCKYNTMTYHSKENTRLRLTG